MSTQIKDTSVSRRQMLRSACVAAGGAALLAGSVSPAQAKMTQQAVNYQQKPNNGASCGSCQYFKAPDACVMVDGPINPDGWCHLYSKNNGS